MQSLNIIPPGVVIIWCVPRTICVSWWRKWIWSGAQIESEHVNTDDVDGWDK